MHGPRTSTIEPNFPPTDQHLDAKRYKIGDLWVDWTGGEAEAVALLLERDKSDAGMMITAAAEARRSAITAAAPGKQGAYLLKYELVLKAQNGDASAQSLLTAEATARGITYDQHILNIAGKRFAWEQAAMAIETVEASSKAAVASASDRAAVDAAVADARQQLAGIGG